jgi:hypothetical protein
MSFLVKRQKIYHLHVKIPRDLQPTLDTDTLTISLGTRSKARAERLKHALEPRIDHAISGLNQEGSEAYQMGRSRKYTGPPIVSLT